MKTSVSTCLWFNRRVKEASQFYVSLIPNSRICGEHGTSAAGEPFMIEISLAGTPYQLLNGGPLHPPTEAASIVVSTDGQAETDRLWTALVAEGGAEGRCGWLKDRFGVSWQIIPRELWVMFSSDDRSAADRAMSSMMKMRKIELSVMRAAFEGAVAVEFTSHLFKFFPQLEQQQLRLRAHNIADLLNQLEVQNPGLRFYLCDELGRLRQHVNIFIGDERIVDRQKLSDALPPGARVLIMQALSGG